ncbi:MAG: extensin family protein [Pseudomonadota bacterium]
MGRKRRKGRGVRLARRLIIVVLLAVGGVYGWSWLQDHPEHNPYAPFDLRHPIGWATAKKLEVLKDDVPECRAALNRSAVEFTALETIGSGECRLNDRTQLPDFPFDPDTPTTTCSVAAGLELWRERIVTPAARDILANEIASIQHLGTFSCRRMYGDPDAPWSEHASANAIDIAGFVLADGREISVLRDWPTDSAEAKFLRGVRDGACGIFSTVLSPDYNAAHADHFHFDQATRWAGVCR